jgi:hypothetical protein
MGLTPGARSNQTIVESKDKRAFAWEKAVVINIQILNAIAFYDITGLMPPPAPISFQEYTKAGLPFYKSEEKGAPADGGQLKAAKSVRELDLNARLVWDVQFENPSDLIGCAFCEINLCDTM